MLIDTCDLLNLTIQNLEMLAEILRNEVTGRSSDTDELTSQARTCKEVGLSISILVPKLQIVREIAQTPQFGRCANCDEL